jgi:hypothetical protein
MYYREVTYGSWSKNKINKTIKEIMSLQLM